MLQARLLGKELYVGVHSDEEILHNKGPVVMRLDERMAAVEACKWSTRAVADAPYVTDAAFVRDQGCQYVVHGDDITTDANGDDCYKAVKDLGMFVVVRRTPNILTTDLVGRMLLMSKTHHYKPITGRAADHALFADDALDRFRSYASDALGLHPGLGVYVSTPTAAALEEVVAPSGDVRARLAAGIVYVDGGFDLFHPGHIEALRLVREHARKTNAAVVVGLHDDKVINEYKGLNYPIMSLFERSLCVLQCRYVDSVVVGAPYVPTEAFLAQLPGPTTAVFHGPTLVDEGVYDGVTQLFREIGPHRFDDMNTQIIVDRVLSNKAAYEERQRRKGWKAEVEQRLKLEESARK